MTSEDLVWFSVGCAVYLCCFATGACFRTLIMFLHGD